MKKNIIIILSLVFFSISCESRNLLREINLEELFPQLKSPKFISKDVDEHSDNWNYFNIGNLSTKDNYYSNITGDFNKDSISDLAFIGKYISEENKRDTLCFCAILSLPKNAEPKVDFLLTTFAKNLSINKDPDLSDNEIDFVAEHWAGILVKWDKTHYISEPWIDEYKEDSSLKLKLLSLPKLKSCLVFISESNIKVVSWSGYAPSHKKYKNGYSIIDPEDYKNGDEIIIFPPDMSQDWVDETLTFYNKIILLLLKMGPDVDYLAGNIWGEEFTDKSIEEIISEIGSENILKRWEINEEILLQNKRMLYYP